MSAVRDLPEEPHPDRIRLRYLQLGEDGAVKEARVPAGTTLFDAGSWNGVAIDSTCGGHGTCKKCKVRVASGVQEISSACSPPWTTSSFGCRSTWSAASGARCARATGG